MTVIRRPRRRLTPAERAVLRSIAKGHGQKATAAELGITTQTVKNHIHNALVTLEAGSAIEAFVILGWLQPRP